MFDAVLFLSYGGPESPEEVDPFLDRILSGKRVPAARRDAVRERYLQFDGLSPLPRECRRFLSAFKSMFQESDEKIGVYSGNLYTPPFVADVLEQLERDEVKSVLVFKSSAFVCRHYVDALLNALASCSSEFAKRLVVRFVPPFFETRAFQESVADSIRTALVETPASNSEATRLVLFTAHSIPVAETPTGKLFDSFPSSPLTFAIPSSLEQIPEPLRARLRPLGLDAALAFQSRSGSPSTPWLEPDVKDFLRVYKKETPSLKEVVVVPIGFFFENMETIYDLDVETREVCEELGIEYRRARCVGDSPVMVAAAQKMASLDPSAFPVCVCDRGCCDLSCRLNPTF